MDLNEWILKISDCKKGTQTGGLNLKVRSYSNFPRVKEIYEDAEIKKCKCCGTLIKERYIKVIFNNEPKPLSVFQAELLFMVYLLDKLPYDYAQYHKCKAGKEFIENIKEVLA